MLIPDEPGALGRLFSELGEASINIEDLVLEHSAGAQAGVARVMIDPAVADRCAAGCRSGAGGSSPIRTTSMRRMNG